MKFIKDQKGIHFDPKCVEAWANLCQRDPDVYLYPSQTIKDDNTATFISKF